MKVEINSSWILKIHSFEDGEGGKFYSASLFGFSAIAKTPELVAAEIQKKLRRYVDTSLAFKEALYS